LVTVGTVSLEVVTTVSGMSSMFLLQEEKMPNPPTIAMINFTLANRILFKIVFFNYHAINVKNCWEDYKKNLFNKRV
jgi:hypothetical protein